MLVHWFNEYCIREVVHSNMQSSVQQGCGILVIEDDEAIRRVLTLLLSEEGYRVHAAVDGHDALEYLAMEPVSPKLILLDLMMPTMSGFEFRKRQRQDPKLQHIPVAIISAITTRLDEQQRVELDAVEFLGKPVSWLKLYDLAARYCEA